jgi:hypothetical protein
MDERFRSPVFGRADGSEEKTWHGTSASSRALDRIVGVPRYVLSFQANIYAFASRARRAGILINVNCRAGRAFTRRETSYGKRTYVRASAKLNFDQASYI